jgi:hypothetical protein
MSNKCGHVEKKNGRGWEKPTNPNICAYSHRGTDKGTKQFTMTPKTFQSMFERGTGVWRRTSKSQDLIQRLKRMVSLGTNKTEEAP